MQPGQGVPGVITYFLQPASPKTSSFALSIRRDICRLVGRLPARTVPFLIAHVATAVPSRASVCPFITETGRNQVRRIR